jgi:chloramphenicol 3-O-phosphotransferase
MFIVLVGPKGSGKSHIGRILEHALGVEFFHVEPLWLAYYAECAAAGREPIIAEGLERVLPKIRAALQESEHLCVETTGASREILDALLTLVPRVSTLVVRVTAPLETCLDRIAVRDATDHIPMDAEGIRNVHRLSVAADLQPDLELYNVTLSPAEITARVRGLLRQDGTDTQAASCESP